MIVMVIGLVLGRVKVRVFCLLLVLNERVCFFVVILVICKNFWCKEMVLVKVLLLMVM